ncbi:MAG: hypothetical protein Q9191_007765 [Dirinaria sp. TL-2023a]
MTSSPEIIDPKVARILSFLEPLLRLTRKPASRPFFLALSGLQGSGKSTLVARICASLREAGHHPISVSLDDFYLPAPELQAAATSQPHNKLLKQRGQPGTHDAKLANQVFEQLRRINEADEEHSVLLPTYDKGAHNGRGDRRPRVDWIAVESPVDLVLLEGWCVGFQPSAQSTIKDLYSTALQDSTETGNIDGASLATRQSTGPEVLLEHDLGHLYYANQQLAEYCKGFMNPESFDAVVHLDTENLHHVYEWRLQQEHKLREATGHGMSDEEVELFVLRYMPAYVLYLDRFRKGVCKNRQLRIVIDQQREMVESFVL